MMFSRESAKFEKTPSQKTPSNKSINFNKEPSIKESKKSKKSKEPPKEYFGMGDLPTERDDDEDKPLLEHDDI